MNEDVIISYWKWGFSKVMLVFRGVLQTFHCLKMSRSVWNIFLSNWIISLSFGVNKSRNFFHNLPSKCSYFNRGRAAHFRHLVLDFWSHKHHSDFNLAKSNPPCPDVLEKNLLHKSQGIHIEGRSKWFIIQKGLHHCWPHIFVDHLGLL